MANKASMTAPEAESILGARGHLRINTDNRLTVRKWLTAQGFPSGFVAGLSMVELGAAYNDTTGKGLDKLRHKLAESAELLSEDEPTAETAVSSEAK